MFGSLCFAHNQRAKGDKFASRTRKCIFVGYPFGTKGWSLFDLDTKKFFVSHDVKFFEHVFPYLQSEDKNLVPENEQNGLGINLDLCDYDDTDLGQLPAPCVQPLPMA